LKGQEVGTVSEQEERIARKKIAEINEKRLAERGQVHNSVKTVTTLVSTGRIPDSQLRKIDAPLMRAEEPSMRKPATNSPVCPELMPVYDALVCASNAMPALAGDLDMQIALLSTIEMRLRVVIETMRERKGEDE
jgi:hypothetical protein